MQPGCATVQKFLAECRGHLDAELDDGIAIITKVPESLQNPSRDLGTTGLGKTRELGAIGDRHDARHYWNVDAKFFAGINEVIVGIGIVKVLCNRTIGTGVDFSLEVGQVLLAYDLYSIYSLQL